MHSAECVWIVPNVLTSAHTYGTVTGMAQETTGPSRVDEIIGERVHAAMWRSRITQKQLAAVLGLDQGSVSRRLRGRAPWRASDVVLAAQLVGVSPGDLMPTGEDTAAVIRDVAGENRAMTSGNFRSPIACMGTRADRRAAVRRAQAVWGTAELIAGAVAA